MISLIDIRYKWWIYDCSHSVFPYSQFQPTRSFVCKIISDLVVLTFCYCHLFLPIAICCDSIIGDIFGDTSHCFELSFLPFVLNWHAVMLLLLAKLVLLMHLLTVWAWRVSGALLPGYQITNGHHHCDFNFDSEFGDDVDGLRLLMPILMLMLMRMRMRQFPSTGKANIC